MGILRQWEKDYWDAQPMQQKCADCGKKDVKHHVQPQLPGRKSELPTWKPYALCVGCIDARNRRAEEERRRQLAEREDCMRCGERPVTWRVGPWRLCGYCKSKTQKEHRKAVAGLGFLVVLDNPTGTVDTSGWAFRRPAKEVAVEG